MAADLEAIVADLTAEQTALDEVVAPLGAAELALPTPAEGWSVGDQVIHLAYFDDRAALAARDPDAFGAHLVEVAADPEALLTGHLDSGRALAPDGLLRWWREGRATLRAALLALAPGSRVPWYGPPMSPASFATARLMETWCHGQDIVDALGTAREPTARLRHIAHIAVRARTFNYVSHGLTPRAEDIRVELTAPDGALWTWGEPDAPGGRVRGSALDFALATTQRRHLADTWLEIDGAIASEWMGIAQAFAGAPGPGRQPGQFPRTSATATTA